jgi:hypothetical protein
MLFAVVTASRGINGDNLENLKREASRHFRNKGKVYPNELSTNSKNKNIKDLVED